MDKSPQEVGAALAAPFDLEDVHFKPQAVSGSRALAIAYTDARAIQDRLDDVLGVDGWQDDYQCLADGSVVCRLRLRLGGAWVTKVDVGSPSEQPDGGDRLKAAFSDGLKRAAVKFGIGRYLYRLPAQWLDYDPKAKRFTSTPQLPAWALPSKEAPVPGAGRTEAKGLPADGAELERRLTDYDARLAEQGLCLRGELVQHVVQAVTRAGHGSALQSWSGQAILQAVEETKAFEQAARMKAERQRAAAAARLAGQGSSKSA